MTIPWTGWILLLVQAIGFAALVYGGWRALFGDSDRGARRCSRCWYDMSWTESTTCPECGFEARSEKALRRTRRRLVLGSACLAGAAAFALWTIDGVWTRGWTSYVPDRAVVWLLPVDSNSGVIRSEVELRMRYDMLGDGALLSLLRRATEGAGDAVPGTTAWDDRYRTLTLSVARHLLYHDDEQLRRSAADMLHEFLLSDPPEITLGSRSSWPSGMAHAIDVQVTDWIELPMPIRITLTPRLDSAAEDVHVRWQRPIQQRDYTLFLPALPAGEHEVVVDAVFERRSHEAAGWVPAGTTTLQTTFHVGSPPMTPVESAAMDEAVRSSLAGGIVKWTDGSLPVRVNVNPQPSYVPLFEDVAIGARIEVRRNGVPARGLEIWWKGGESLSRGQRQHAWEVPMMHDSVMNAPHSSDDEWTIHVVSSPELAHRVDGASKYWRGAFEFVVPATAREGSAPSRGWIPVALVDGEGDWPNESVGADRR